MPQKDGSVLSAATREEGNFDQVVTGEAISQMVAKAKEIFPILNDAQFVSASAGVRPGTPDGMPILGPLPGWSGVSIASGHDRVGIMCSPRTAELMADFVANGDCSRLAPFTIERFGF
ncbi:MAG: FAD-dependent oxidoreductase [SAR202 cluster bacterium]|nr:FAD-dependent oxidoreductase [SAR202 cluster bacterium]